MESTLAALLLQLSPNNPQQESLSVIDLAFEGGFTMIPILLLSVAGLYIFFERIITIKRAARNPQGWMRKVKQLVLEGNIEAAKQLCENKNTPIARMIAKGLSRIGSPLKNIETSIEYVGKIEVYRLERNLSMLATIAGAAPMVGFLGTVIGMIQAFMVISQQEGAVSPQLLSSGIYTAMVTTVAGLIVGILMNLAYNYLVGQVQKVIHNMEYISMDFLDLLQEPQKK
ncbi:MotA/TolQ/ExbB proton channel family protein [Eisenibacter elegans]|jgi:biopolymer transport protein ExbB|uniref:MotA/TolQ/ExbB proton channel family protein n=1 Tax=Eisenibacter elegans TaxID=997 RepID=UPI00040E0F11|nr:MotA/TolQ/ExbB proton channel family protein [Eisenibacter elegans]